MRNLFSYKNLSSYSHLYDFDHSSVISLIDSGDDYLSCLLNGCDKVDLFDKDNMAYEYLLFKIEAIKNLSYEEFFKLFVIDKLNNEYLIHKILVSSEIKTIKINNPKVRKDIKYDNGEFIPYLDKNNYYKLQSILKGLNYPEFYKTSIWKLKDFISYKYDIMLSSSIFDDLYQKGKVRGIKNYKKLLDSFDINRVQAYYCQGFMDDKVEIEFLNRGFDIDYVDGVNKRDSIISLIRK